MSPPGKPESQVGLPSAEAASWKVIWALSKEHLLLLAACVPVISRHANFLAKTKEILARVWLRMGSPLIQAINIPNNVLLLPFLPEAFGFGPHSRSRSRSRPGFRYGSSNDFDLASSWPADANAGIWNLGELTHRQGLAKGNITNTARNPFAAMFSHLLCVHFCLFSHVAYYFLCHTRIFIQSRCLLHYCFCLPCCCCCSCSSCCCRFMA